MAAITYPATLPVPQSAPIQSTERRAVAPDGGPYEVRALQRDRHAIQRITLPPLNETDSAIFQAWWKDDLFFGGAWFAATWPLPQGMVAGVRRFMAPPHWELLRSPQGNYWRISFDCEVRGRGELPEVLVEDCDLLMRFDEANANNWRDFSPFRREIIVSPGIGTIVGDASTGVFGRGALVTNPSAGTNADVAHPIVTAAGNINFGASDFWISFYLDLTAGLPGNSGNFVFLSNINYGLDGGWLVQISTDNLGTQTLLEFSFITAAGLDVKRADIDVLGLTGRHHFACSRAGGKLVSYLDAARYAISNAFIPTDTAIDDAHAGVISLFSYPSEPGHRIAGFKGGMDELYINHGPGCGVDEATFTLPVVPLVSTVPIRTQLGLS